ncbi:TPA: SIS domain-containing protein [Photobacterium damselae]
MMTYIDQQPEILSSIASGKNIPEVQAALTKVLPNQLESLRVVMVASGTSLNAARVAADHFPCPVEYYYPYDFTMYNDLTSYDENTLFIFISQGGSSLSTYTALQHVKDKFKTLALVGDVSKPIALEADAAIEFGCGLETVIYRTKGYTSSALTLCSIGETISHNEKLYTYQQQAQSLHSFIQVSKAFVERHLSEMSMCSAWMVAGSGINNVTAVEGALKIIETIRVPSMAFDLEEFIHGAQNSIVDTTRVVVIENFDDQTDKAFNLFKALRLIGIKSYLISAKPHAELQDYILLRPEYLIDEITAVIPLQHISFLVSQAKGVDLTKSGLPQLSEHLAKSL